MSLTTTSQGIGSRSSRLEGEKASLTLSYVLGMDDACMYHYDRHYSDAVHEDDDFRNRLCFSPVEDLGGWRKIMSIGVISVRGSIIYGREPCLF